jgi:plastocyanin
MTTETPQTDEVAADEPGDTAADAPPAEPTEAEPVPAASTSEPSFWQRPYVERYLVPFVLPLVVILGVVIVVLNLSRIFLSLHGNIDVLVGSAILLVILIGAAILSASPAMRTSSLALIVGGFVLTITMGGWLALGSAEPEEEGGEALAPDGPATQTLEFQSSNALVFVPDATQSATGIVRITMTNEGGEHTFQFEDPNTLLETLQVNAPGDTSTGRAYLGEAGDYVFYCTIPGHREAGMEGVVTADGPSVPLAEAEAQAEEAPAGETPTPTSAPGAAPGGQPDAPDAPAPAEDADR